MPKPRHSRPTLPKTLTSALLALSVIASSLLAVAIAAALPVALPDSTPAAAQQTPTGIAAVTTTVINIDQEANDGRTSDAGINHTLTASNCDAPTGGQSAIVSTAQSNTTAGAAIDEPGNTDNKIFKHTVDYRCDWTITFSIPAEECVSQIHPRGFGSTVTSGPSRGAYTTVDVIKLSKNPDYPDAVTTGGGDAAIEENRRLVADVNNKDNSTVHSLEVLKCAGVTLVDIETDTLFNNEISQSWSEAGFTGYRIDRRSCSGHTPSNQTPGSARPHPTNSKISRHLLPTNCKWLFHFDLHRGNCMAVSLGYRDTANPDKDIILETLHAFEVDVLLEKDPDGSGTGEPHNLPRLTFGNRADNTVNVINLKFISQVNGQCFTPVRLYGGSSQVVDAGVQVTLEPVKGKDPCTPNSNSSTRQDSNFEPLIRRNISFNYLLGRNCDWLITFTSNQQNCTASARPYNDGNRAIMVPQGDDEAQAIVRAGPGESATIRLTGFDNRLDWVPSNRHGHHIGAIEFRGCDGPVRSSRLFIDRVPATGQTLEVQSFSYRIEADECDGIGLPPTQRHTEIFDGTSVETITDGLIKSGNANRRVHWLNYQCDWELNFSTPEHCEVSIAVRFAPGVDAKDVVLTTGSLGLVAGSTFKLRTEDFAAGVSFADATQTVAAHTDAVKSLSLTTASSGGKCASDIDLSNIADAGAGKQVKVAAVPQPEADTTADPPVEACGPHDRGPAPEGKLALEAGESSSLRLARNCGWKLNFEATNLNCVASAQVKDTNGANLGTAVTTSFGSSKTTRPTATVELGKDDAGLTYTYDDDGTATTVKVGAIEFDGCVDAMTPDNTVKLTVIDSTPSVNFAYEISSTSSTCAGGSRPANQSRVEAITTGNQGVHYLDHRCDWNLDAVTGLTCGVTLTVKDANNNTLGTETSSNNRVALVSDTTANSNRLLYGAVADAKVVASVTLAANLSETACLLPVKFLNLSQPSGMEIVTIRNAPAELLEENTVTIQQAARGDLPLPRIGMSLTPLNDAGAACTTHMDSTKPSGTVTIDAMELVTTGSGDALRLVLDDQGNYQFTPNSESYRLDKACNWQVEFVSEVGDTDAVCFSSAQLRGHDGARLGHAVLAGPYDGDLLEDVNNTPNDRTDDVVSEGPFNGGFFTLASGASGLTYEGSPVGSVEFLGCLPEDYPRTAVVQIIDGTGVAGSLSYTIAPAVDELPQTADERDAGDPVEYQSSCEAGVPVPPSQSLADGAVLSDITNLYQHHLSYDCDWDITFTGVPECLDAVTVWAEGEAGLEFADAVTETQGSGLLQLRLTQRYNAGSSSGDNAAEATGTFGYYVGSGGGRKLASDATGVPAGNASDDPSLVTLAALSVECASEVGFDSVSGLEGPGLELAVTSPGSAGVGSAASVCVSNQDRLPGTDVLEAGGAAFKLPLNRSCAWNITFKSQATACLAAARVFDASTPPQPLGGLLRTTQDESLTIELAANAEGLQYTPSGGSAATVGSVEFYDCFYPSVSLSDPTILAGTEFTSTFTAVGSKAGCTASATQTTLAGDPSLTYAQRVAAAEAGLAFGTQVKGGRALLNSLATDGSFCEYDVSVTGPAALGQLVPARISAQSSFVTVEQATIALTLRNQTSLSASGLTAARRNVTVTVTPQAPCSQDSPAESPYTLTAAGTANASSTVRLGVPACVWTVSYRTANSDCLVSAQFKGADGSALGAADTSGSLEITSRVGVSRATQIAAIEFTVLSCYSAFEATLTVNTTDGVANTNHAGTVFEAVINPVPSDPAASSDPLEGCSSERTVRLTLGSGSSAADTATASVMLANVPEGQSGGQPASCAYEVSFADSVVTAGRVLFTRTSPVAAASLSASSASVTASYTASRPAAVGLVNATLFTTTHTPASRRDVVVTATPVASSSCTESAPSASPHTIYAASETAAVLGTQVCAWTISYANTAADCVVEAQLKDTADADIGSPDADGELVIHVNASQQVRSAAAGGGTQVGSIEFTVGATCHTLFDGTVSVSVTGATAGDHEKDAIVATVSRAANSHADCSVAQAEEVLLKLDNANAASVTLSDLVNLPAGQTMGCVYIVTFPERDAPNLSDGNTVALERTSSATAELSAASATIAATYEATTLAALEMVSGNFVVLEGLIRRALPPDEAGFSYMLTPSCDTSITPAPTAQTQAHGTPRVLSVSSYTVVHLLDYRCDWSVVITYRGTCPNPRLLPFHRASRSTGHDPIRLTAGTAHTIELLKDATNKRLNYRPGSTTLVLNRIAMSYDNHHFDGRCETEVLVAAEDGASDIADWGLSYTLAPHGCLIETDVFSVAHQNRPAAPVMNTVNYRHLLDVHCNWVMTFSLDSSMSSNNGKCLLAKIAYQPPGDGALDEYATRSAQLRLQRDEPNLRLVYGPGNPVNRILVSRVDQTDGTCASPVLLQNWHEVGVRRNLSGGNLKISVRAEQARAKRTDLVEVCTPNAASDTVAEINSRFENSELIQSNSQATVLGHNCDWLVTFGSANPNCAAAAVLYNGDTQLTRNRRTVARRVATASDNALVEPYVLVARPGETATLRLQGKADGIKANVYGSGFDQSANGLVVAEADIPVVSRVEFDACFTPSGITDILLTDKSPVEVEVNYEFVPVACHGITAQAQDNSDSVELTRYIPTYVRATAESAAVRGPAGNDEKSGTFQQLSFFCDWEVSFSTPNNCEVAVRLRYLDLPDWDSDDLPPEGLVNGSDIVTDSFRLHAPIDDSSGEVHRNYLLYGDDGFKNVIELEYSVAADLSKCATPVELKNASTEEGLGAVQLTVETKSNCVPARGGVPGALTLAAQESVTVELDNDCTWEITYGSVETRLCKAAAQVQGVDPDDDFPLLRVPADPTDPAETKVEEAKVELAKGNAGLTAPDDERVAKLVRGVEFWGCENRERLASDTMVTVIYDTGMYDFVEYGVQVAYCDQNVTSPPDQTQADVVSVTGRQRVHYLDYRCTWTILFHTPFAGCITIVTAEDAAETVFTSDTDGSLSIYNDTAGKRFTAGSSAPGNTQEVKVVRAVIQLDDPVCHPTVEFENRSQPFAFSVGDLDAIKGALPTPRGTAENPSDELPELAQPFPRVVLQLTPVTAAGAACTTTNNSTKPAGVVTLDAMRLEVNANNVPELTADGGLQFSSNKAGWRLDKSCNWQVEFVSEVTGGNLDCFASAQAVGLDGTRLGNPVGAGAYDGELQTPRNAQGAEDPAGTDFGPFGGGTLVLQSGTNGLTYQGSVVGKVEFLGCVGWESSVELDECIRVVRPADVSASIVDGEVEGELVDCLEQDYSGQAEFHIRDLTDPVGDVRYTIAPAVANGLVQCVGVDSAPPTQTQADGVVFAEAPGSYAHFLDTRCEWEVTVARQTECDALGVWGARPDSGAEAMDGSKLQDGHLVFFGSVTSDVLSVGLVPSVDDSPAGGPSMEDDTATPLVGLTLECVSVVDLRSVSGAWGPGLDIMVQPVARAQVGGQAPPYDPSVACERHQRYPLVADADDLPTDDALLPRETIGVALNRDCGWEIEFQSRDDNCVTAARVLDAAGDLLGAVVRTTAGSAATLTFAAGASGVAYPATGGSSGAAAAVEFYDCFTPQVSFEIASLTAEAEFEVSFEPVGAKAGCTTGASQTMVAADPALTDKARVAAAGLGYDLDTRVKGDPARLVGLATDNTLCEYEVTADGPNNLDPVGYRGQVSPRAGFVIIEQLVDVGLKLRNATLANSPGHADAAQRTVLVTVDPKAGECNQDAPAGSPFTLSAASMTDITLPGVACVWTVTYRNMPSNCRVEARFKDSAGMAVANTSVDDDGMLEITTRHKVADSTPVAELEFTVGAVATHCTSTFPATISVTVDDSQPGADHTGREIPVRLAPVAMSDDGCTDEASHTLRVVSGNTASEQVTLVGAVLGVACVYEATFPAMATAVANKVDLERSSTSAEKVRVSASSSERTASATYVAADITGPVVTGLSVSPGSVDIDAEATVSITLSEAPAAGTFDAADVAVTETSGSGVVTKGILTGAGTSWSLPLTGKVSGSVSIEVTAGSFTDAAGNPNTVTASAVSLTVNAARDTTGPEVTRVTVSPTSVDIDAVATVSITLSEAPAAGTFDASDVRVTETSGSGVVTKGALTGAGTSWSLALTGKVAGSVSIEVTAGSFTDAAGNPNTVTASAVSLTVNAARDTTGPEVTGLSVSPASVDIGAEATVNITLSEAPGSGTFDAADVVVTETSGSGVVTKGVLSGAGTSWSLPLMGKVAGSVSIAVRAGSFTDAAGNPNTVTASSVSLTVNAARDTTGPEVTRVTVSPTSVDIDAVATVNITLSEAPAAGTFDASDVRVTETSGSGVVTKGTLTGAGTSWSLPLTGKAAGSVSIEVTTGSFTDAAGNPNTVTASAVSLTVNAARDTTGPAVTRVSVSPASVDIDAVATVNITLSEAPAAGTFDASDVRVTETSGSGVVTKGTLTGAGTSWSLPLTGKAAGSVSIEVTTGSFTDAAGNPNTVTASAVSLTVNAARDTTGPAVTGLSVSPTSMNIGSAATVRITLSEAPAAGTFDASDISVTPSGVVTKGTLTGAGTSWSLPLTGRAAGSVSITVRAGSFTDAANNPNTVTASPARLTVSAAPVTPTPTPSVPPPTPGVSVLPAGSVTEGETLRFAVSLPDRAAQQVTVSYTTSLGGSGSVPIEAGRLTAVIEVPTQDNELDEADQTVRVTLTGATGGAAVASVGRTATGIVRDDDPSPLVGLGSVVIDGNRVRFKVVLSAKSGRDVRASYTSPAGSGNVVISAGQLDMQASQVFDRALLAASGSLRMRLTSAQNATIDPNARERVVRPGGSWQFHQVSRDGGVRASQLAQALELGGSWRLFSWNTTSQRWVEHSPAANSNATLPAGVTVTYRGPEHSQTTLAAAGLGRPESITLAQGWNIFTPDPAAVGLTSNDFTRTQDGVSAVIFDPRLIDCDNLAGLLVIYTFDQNDPRSQNGFRLTLPCHPELQAQLGIPAIETIDQNDTIYAWFNNTTPVQATFTDGQYTPAG